MDTIYSQSQEIFNSDKISSLQHAKMNDTDSVPHVSNIISHLKYTNKIGIEFLHFTSNPSRHTMTMESASHPSLLRRDAPSIKKRSCLSALPLLHYRESYGHTRSELKHHVHISRVLGHVGLVSGVPQQKLG